MCILSSSCYVGLCSRRYLFTLWLLYSLCISQLICTASGSLDTTLQANAVFNGTIDKHEEDPVTSFWLMYPSNGAVEVLPVKFKYEIRVESMEGYLSYSGDKLLCIELSGGWKKCSPMTKASIEFDDLPVGNYTTRGFITDAVGVTQYHETTETEVSIVSPETFEAYTAAQVEQSRQTLDQPEELSLLKWADQQLRKMEDKSMIDAALNPSPFVLSTDNANDLFLVIGIKTMVVNNFSLRQAIRDTWASRSALPRDVRVLFVGCVPTFDNTSKDEREQLQHAINLEKRMYGDLLTDELQCEDSYPGLANKVKDFLRFATQKFPQTPFVMIADDDIYLRADHLTNRLRNEGRFQRLYIGQVWDSIFGHNQVPVRDERNRYYLPKEIYSLGTFPPFAFGPHYVMSRDCARFIAKNEWRLRGLEGMDDISIALWLMTIQVHVEHTTKFSSLRILACKNDLFSFADLTSLGIRSIHENLLEHRDFCYGFDKVTWHRDERLLHIGRPRRSYSLPLDIQAYVHNVSTSGVLEVTSTISSPNKGGVSLSYFPSVEPLSVFSGRVCDQAHILMAETVYNASICAQVALELQKQLQRLYNLAKKSEEIALPFLELWRYNLFIADPNTPPVIVAYSPTASYSLVVLECIFASVFEHKKRPILVVPEDILRKHYQNTPEVFVFSVFDADCQPLSKLECQKTIAHYIREYSSSAGETNVNSAKLMMIAGEPTTTEALDDHVLLLSTVSRANREKYAYISVASSSFGERMGHTPMALLSPGPELAAGNERKFCAYLYARCDRPQREYMFDILNTMEPVDALGVCVGTSRPPNETRITSRLSRWYNDDAVHRFRSYKFVIAFENSLVPGYVTEKLVNPFLAGSIPIYLGNSTAASQLFNPESFIDCGRFEVLRDCAEFVMQVHESPELYEKMRRQPPIRNISAFNEAFSWYPSVPSSALADAVGKLLRL